MKKSFLLLCLLATACSPPAPIRTVSVRGEGEVKVQPDKADVFLQVQTKGKDARSAQAANAQEMARVQKVLREEFKLAEADIQTSGFSVNPDYRFDAQGKRTFLGYQVQHSLTLTLHALDTLGALLDGVVGRGTEDVSVQVQNVSFGSEKRQALEVKALDLAMANAKSRAEGLAKSADRKVKGVMRISDSSVSFQSPPFARPMMKSAMLMDGAAAASTPIAPGEITINSTVAVEYEID